MLSWRGRLLQRRCVATRHPPPTAESVGVAKEPDELGRKNQRIRTQRGVKAIQERDVPTDLFHTLIIITPSKTVIDITKDATTLRTEAAQPVADGCSGGARSTFRAALDSVYLQRFQLHHNPRFDTALTATLVAIVALSRWLAMPASIWDQDEAIFATALVHFDPSQNYPHPPFFPLWVLLGPN